MRWSRITQCWECVAFPVTLSRGLHQGKVYWLTGGCEMLRVGAHRLRKNSDHIAQSRPHGIGCAGNVVFCYALHNEGMLFDDGRRIGQRWLNKKNPVSSGLQLADKGPNPANTAGLDQQIVEAVVEPYEMLYVLCGALQ